MSVQKFASVVREHVRRDMNNYCDDLANGVCKSFDEYQKLCGVIRGLALAEEHLLALLEKVEKSDE
jgi:hypothetical protein